MKKRLLQTSFSLILFLFTVSFWQKANAQIGFNNSGFESGQNLWADNWKFTHSAKRVKEYTTKNNNTLNATEGEYFLKLETTISTGLEGRRFFGEAEVMLPFIGYPDSMLMQLAHFPVKDAEFYSINCTFIKYEVDFDAEVLLFFFNGNGTSNWHHEGFAFDYSTGKPAYDSIKINFMSSNPNQTGRGVFGLGTALLIDDIQFTGSTLGSNIDLSAPIKPFVFPNPCNTSTTVNFNIPLTTDMTLAITDMQGRTLKNIPITSEQAGSTNMLIDVTGMKPGLYNGMLYTNNNSMPFKLMVTQ